MIRLMFLLNTFITITIAQAQFTAQLNIGKITKSSFETYQSLPISVEEPMTYSFSSGIRLLPGISFQGTYQNDWSYEGIQGNFQSGNRNAVIDFKKVMESYMIDMEIQAMPNSNITPLLGMGIGQAVIRQTSILSVLDQTYPGIYSITYCPMSEEIKTTAYKIYAGIQLYLSEHYFMTAKYTKKWLKNDERFILKVNDQDLYTATIGLGVQL